MLLASCFAALAAPEDQLMTNANGATLHWDIARIVYDVDPANEQGLPESEVVAAVGHADDAWDGVPASDFAFEQGGVRSGIRGGYDEQNGVWFVEDWTSSPELLALTSVWSDEEGVIRDFDMAINADDHDWSLAGDPDRVDLWNAMAHEFGHAIGLGHNEEDASATMYGYAELGETGKRDLAESDAAAAEYLYGDVFDDVGVEAHAMGCVVVPSGAGLLALPSFILAILRRKEDRC
jgi:hypothetical protein